MECVICQKSFETRACSSCKEVYYCSVAHQKQHWPIHKSECGPFRVVDSGDTARGKYCVANRDLLAGEIILDEPAAFYSPWLNNKELTCVSCGIYFQDKKAAGSCSKCGYPVCGTACEKNPVHSKNECEVLAKDQTMSMLSREFLLQDSMMFAIIRGAALKKQRPKVYKGLLQLEHTSCSEEFQYYIDKQARAFLQTKRALNSPLLTFDDVDYRIIGGIAEVNAFRQVAVTRDIGKTKTENKGRWCVYVKASRLNHSCVPNCTWITGPGPECRIRVIVATPIKKDEEITIFYSGIEPDIATEATHERRRILKYERGIDCKCPRCVDPTELGTYSSAVTCKACKKRLNESGVFDSFKYGYLLAENPLDDSPKALWKCNICEEKSDSQTILPMVEEIQSELTSKFRHFKHADIETYLQNLEKPVKKYLGSVLHPNNWVIAGACLAIGNNCSSEIKDPAPPLSAVERHIEWMNYTLALCNKLFPGLSEIRAHLLVIFARLINTKIVHFGSSFSKEELTKYCVLSVKSHWEAFQFFKCAFCRPGEQLTYMATEILKSIQAIKWQEEILADDDDELKTIFDDVDKWWSELKIQF